MQVRTRHFRCRLSLRTEAKIIGDAVYDEFQQHFTRDVAALLAAVRGNRRNEWLVETFGAVYPDDMPDAEVIADLLMVDFRRYALSIAECERCGRLWLQRRVDENSYRSFVPDDGGYGRHFAALRNASQPDIPTNQTMHASGRSRGN